MTVVEIAQFRLKPDVQEADFLAACETTQTYIESLGGLLHREIVKSDDGQWVDVVHWASLEQAQQAAATFEHAPEIADFVSMLDFEHTTMQHYHPMKVYDVTKA